MWTRRVVVLLGLLACSGKPGPAQSGPGAPQPPGGAGATAATDGRGAGAGGAAGGTSGAAGAAAGTGAAGAGAAAGSSSGAGPAIPGLPPGAQAVKVTLAEVGLEASSLDRTADPCVDFYQFACGGWLQNHPIPADRPGWSRFAEIQEKNQAALRGLLEEAAKGIGADAGTKRLGDFYAACMDEAAIGKAGTAALAPLLDRVAKIKDARSWLAALAELHKLGRWVVWRVRIDADLKESSTNIVYLDAAGLGLPDRDYYARPDLKTKVDMYRAHVARTLALTGTPPARAEAAAADVVAIEGELAKLMKSRAEQRDLPAMYNPIEQAALARQAKSIDWKAYWKALGAEPTKQLVLGTPKFFAQLDTLRAAFKWPQWASYFTYHLVHGASLALPRPFDDEAFELVKAVRGIERPEERARRCIAATRDALGELLGAKYIEKHFAPQTRQTASRMMDAIAEVMHTELGKVDWMTDAARQLAQGKLTRMVRMTGHPDPDRWRTYEYEVRRDDFLGTTLRAAAFETRYQLAKAGRPADRNEWRLQVYDSDAWYEPTANHVELPAGILQPPFFGPDRAIAANLGGIGMMIGHELTHGFDDQGARFDGTGNLASWWDKQDERRFEERGACVADLYSSFEAAPGAFVNGKLTLGENIADLGGVKVAFGAYRAMRRDAAKVYVADGFTEDQQFFLAVGQAWCSRDRPDDVQRRLYADVHAPPKFRVYGALRNLKAFAEAFSCAPGTPMSPAKTCSVW
ncbi:MAG TPA: M13 family metallopeptidase [Kofleriaceae bacterium]|nr:M13 family metallopeptidase [Kofleriaceae bacterium]